MDNRVTFYEPDAHDRQMHRDMPDPAWAKVVVYSGVHEKEFFKVLEAARHADLLISPGHEIIVVVDGRELVEQLRRLTPERAHAIGIAARRRILCEHTYRHRAEQLATLLTP